VQEILFVRNLLLSIGIESVTPAPLFVDNVGAIFIAKNATTKGRTKHMDIRFHFVREQIEEGNLEIRFVRSEDNVADIFTKNTSRATFNRHKEIFVCEDTGEDLEVKNHLMIEIDG
jgi:hypothetical protein